MPATPFRAITWDAHSPITKDKLDAMAFNDIWMKDNSPRAHYSKIPGTEEYDSGLVLVSGRVYVPRRKYDMSGAANVYFGAAFLPGTQPHVTTGIVTDSTTKLWTVVNGHGSTLLPDHRGFTVWLAIETPAKRPKKVRGRTQTNPIVRASYVHWLALGQAAKQL